MKAYTTTVLEKIKNADVWELLEVNEALDSLKGYDKKFFSYIAESNSKGNIPTYNDLKKHFRVSSGNISRNIKNLIYKEMIINRQLLKFLVFLVIRKNVYGNYLQILRSGFLALKILAENVAGLFRGKKNLTIARLPRISVI